MSDLTSLEHLTASVAQLPYQSGDGYGYGGGFVVTIGNRAVLIGEHPDAGHLAHELAARWNAHIGALVQPVQVIEL